MKRNLTLLAILLQAHFGYGMDAGAPLTASTFDPMGVPKLPIDVARDEYQKAQDAYKDCKAKLENVEQDPSAAKSKEVDELQAQFRHSLKIRNEKRKTFRDLGGTDLNDSSLSEGSGSNSGSETEDADPIDQTKMPFSSKPPVDEEENDKNNKPIELKDLKSPNEPKTAKTSSIKSFVLDNKFPIAAGVVVAAIGGYMVYYQLHSQPMQQEEVN